MPAAPKTCVVCGRNFYGRTDASHCSTACRQKAYGQRIRSATPIITGSITGYGPVPIGDTWMNDRFGGRFNDYYSTLAERAKHLEANVKTPAVRMKRLVAAEEDAARVVEAYVDGVAAIGRYSDEGLDCETPLGGSLPATIDAELARSLAASLQAALPRVVELASLLVRRSTQERGDAVEASEVCDVHSVENIKFTSAGEPYCMACDYMLYV